MNLVQQNVLIELIYSMAKDQKVHFIDLHSRLKRTGIDVDRAQYWHLMNIMQQQKRIRIDDFNYVHVLPETTLFESELRALLRGNAPKDYIENLEIRKMGLERALKKTSDELKEITSLLEMVQPVEDLEHTVSLRDKLINSAFHYIHYCPQWQYETVLSFVAAEHKLTNEEVAPYVTVKRFNGLKDNAPTLTPLSDIANSINAEQGASFLDDLQDPWEAYYSRDQFGNSEYLQDNHFMGGAGI